MHFWFVMIWKCERIFHLIFVGTLKFQNKSGDFAINTLLVPQVSGKTVLNAKETVYEQFSAFEKLEYSQTVCFTSFPSSSRLNTCVLDSWCFVSAKMYVKNSTSRNIKTTGLFWKSDLITFGIWNTFPFLRNWNRLFCADYAVCWTLQWLGSIWLHPLHLSCPIPPGPHYRHWTGSITVSVQWNIVNGVLEHNYARDPQLSLLCLHSSLQNLRSNASLTCLSPLYLLQALLAIKKARTK